jgi:hypothetical protein
MSAVNMPDHELFDLMHDQAEGRLAPQKVARLEELLLADPVKRQQYVDFMLLVCGLHCTRSERAESASRIEPQTATAQPAAGPACELSAGAEQPAAPSIGLSAVANLPPLATFSGGTAFSYLVVLLILAAGILAASAWTVPGNERLLLATGNPLPPTMISVPVSAPIIGRITGMANCRWMNPRAAASDVAMGRFSLDAGLLELSYENGTKVIVEGPAKFAADSPNSGFLVFGKVTVRAGKPMAVSSTRPSDAAAGHAVPAVNSVAVPALGTPFAALPSPFSAFVGPSFCLRSRYAKIDDAGGAEFGLHVDRSAAAENQFYVFHGKIDFQLPYDERVIRLEDTEWAFVRLRADHQPVVRYGKVIKSPPSFARQLPKNAPLYSQGNKGAKLEIENPPDS